MLPSEIVNPNITLLYIYGGLEAQESLTKAKYKVHGFYEALHRLTTHCQTVAVMAIYDLILCNLCGDEVCGAFSVNQIVVHMK